MQHLVESVRSYLEASSSITNLTNVISWGTRAPGTSNEWIVLNQVGSRPLQDLSGETGNNRARVQVSCFSLRGMVFAAAIRESVRGLLCGGARTFGDRPIQAVWDAGGELDYSSTEIKAFVAQMDFYIHYDI